MKEREFLYENIYQQLRQEILGHQYGDTGLLPAERELSERFGVERGTVRKALDMLVNAGLVEKKAGVGTRVVDGIADGSASSAKIYLGFIMVDDAHNPRRLTQPYYSDLFYHLENACKEQGCQLIYASVSQYDDLSHFLGSYDFRSVIFITHINNSYIRYARDLGIPTILVNERYPGVATISYDNEDGAYQVIRYLVQMGHRKIAVVTGPKEFYTSNVKLAGCYRAAAEYGISFTHKNIFVGDWEYHSGYEGARSFFEKRPPEEQPTAIFAFNDMMCIGTMNALRDMGYKIPEDVSVVGFDNMEQLKYGEQNMTTVDANVAAMSRLIVKCAAAPQFTESFPDLKLIVPVKLILRETVAHPKRTSKV